jgi:hypothetical protein
MTAIIQSSFGCAETRRRELRATAAIRSAAVRFPTGAIGSYRELPGPRKFENPVPAATGNLLSQPILQLISTYYRLLPPITAYYGQKNGKAATAPSITSGLAPTCTYLHQLAPTCRKKISARRHLNPDFPPIRVIRVIRSQSLYSYSRLLASIRGCPPCPVFRIWRCPKPS